MGAIIWTLSAIFLVLLTGTSDTTPAVKNRKLEVSKLLSKLASSDINAFHPSNGQLFNVKSDLSHPNVLLEKAFLEQPTYAALKSLCSFYTSNQVQNANRPLSFSKKIDLEDDFLEAVGHTALFQSALQFLRTKGILPNDHSTMLSHLRELWFTGEGFQQSFCGLAKEQEKVYWMGSYLLAGQHKEREETKRGGVLVGTSPEFELAVYTVCALAQPINFIGLAGQVVHKKCVFDHLDNEVKAVVAVELGDGSWQSVLSAHLDVLSQVTPALEHMEHRHKHNSSHRPPHKKNETADPDLQKLVDALWAADAEDRVSNSSITFNWGNKADGEKDVSPDPLFNNVNEDFLERPVYKALLNIYNHSLFHPEVCTAEASMDDERHAALDTFLTTVTNTTVFKLAYDYLKERNKTGSDYDSFHKALFDLWFGTYSRCNGAKGSSGWEHVFSGEFRDVIIEGQHYWVRFYLLEKAGYINYHGYFAYDANLLGTIQYKWNNYIKRIGGFLLRSSPAFDLSLFTVCSFTYSGNERCKFSINGNPLYVTSFKQSCDSGICLSTSYPGMKF